MHPVSSFEAFPPLSLSLSKSLGKVKLKIPLNVLINSNSVCDKVNYIRVNFGFK